MSFANQIDSLKTDADVIKFINDLPQNAKEFLQE
jgi:hypothetical protein